MDGIALFATAAGLALPVSGYALLRCGGALTGKARAACGGLWVAVALAALAWTQALHNPGVGG